MEFETPTLQTERLTLRPVTKNDIPTVQYEFGRWNIIKYMTTKCPWPYPDNGAHFWFHESVLKRYTEKSAAVWAITRKEKPTLLLGVIDIREDTGEGNRGFWMAESEQGKGYMTEAVTAVNDWVFAHTELEELVVYNVASNEASRQVKQKTGATLIKTVVEEYHIGECESQMWRVDKAAWLAARNKD